MLLDAWLPHGLRLMQQSLALGDAATLELVVPADVDAVCDLYIGRGAPQCNRFIRPAYTHA